MNPLPIMMRFCGAFAALVLCFAPIYAAPARAQPPGVKTTFVPLAHGVPGVLYEPTQRGPHSQIAVLIMHSSADYLTFSGCLELSRRGYTVLCANNTTDKSQTFNDGLLNDVLLQVKLGVQYLRAYSGVRKVVLLGHSGGGTVMSAYQDIAENGVKACQGPEKIAKCPDSLAGLPPADGLMLIDSNFGQAEMTLFSIDPAVRDERTGMSKDSRLDLFNPANGFNPSGSRYGARFIYDFLRAEGQRSNALLKSAQDRLEAIEAGRGQYADDEMFVVPGAVLLGSNNKLFAQDTALLSHTQQAWPLIKPNGSVVTQIVHTVRVPENTRDLTPSLLQGALKTTVRNYLTSFAIRVDPDFGYDEDKIYGVEWTSTYASPPGNVEGVSAPLLTLGMTGHWEFLAAEAIYDHAKSTDKSLAFVEGGTHLYTTCKKCERYPGQFGDTEKTTYDYIGMWLGKRGRFLE
ncbi:MAG: alpha/beta hydrolase family protein [Caulobacteraceae bacterium]